ncbi:MAG: dockerin type I repeat-containing protein [Planctomycetota bacterium]
MPQRMPARTIFACSCFASWLITTDATALPPEKLLIFYGWPSTINMTYTVPLAAAEFGVYEHVVLGDGLQDGPSDPLPHPDHQNTIDILQHAATTGTQFYGYISIGVSTVGYPLAEIERRADGWAAMGFDGILLDEFGYDYNVSRERQNAVVDYVHGLGLKVIANGWIPADVFGVDITPLNPTGAATSLNAFDFFLFESHQVQVGAYADPAFWLARATALSTYQTAIGFDIMSITTADVTSTYSESQFFYSWYSAALFGHRATGWGEYIFSATGASAGLAPFRARPAVDLGADFASEVVITGANALRATTRGVIAIDTGAFNATFTAGAFIRGDCNGDGALNIADAIYLLTALFAGGAAPGCDDACDANDTGLVDIADVIYTLSTLFSSGPPPPPPGMGCGGDVTSDALACAGFSACP